MPLWTLEKPPVEATKRGLSAYLDQRGWIIPYPNGTYDIIAMGNRAAEAGAANIVAVRFANTEYSQGDPIDVIVTFNELVSVVAGITLEVSWSGLSGNFTVTAPAQTSVSQVVFSGVVPLEAGDLNISSQTLLGTITDSGDATPSDLIITAEVAGEVTDITVV